MFIKWFKYPSNEIYGTTKNVERVYGNRHKSVFFTQ